MFNDMLRTQLLLKNIITPEDWEYMSDHIQYDFLYDNHFAELKDAELLRERVTLATELEPFVGRYYSTDYVRRKVLRQTDEEIIEQDELIKDEIESGAIPDPAMMAMGDPNAMGGDPALGGGAPPPGPSGPPLDPPAPGDATRPELRDKGII